MFLSKCTCFLHTHTHIYIYIYTKSAKQCEPLFEVTDWCVCGYLYFSVCKLKAHKRCAVRATNNCKWTTLASIGKDIIEDEDGVSLFVRLFFFKFTLRKAYGIIGFAHICDHKAIWSECVFLSVMDKKIHSNRLNCLLIRKFDLEPVRIDGSPTNNMHYLVFNFCCTYIYFTLMYLLYYIFCFIFFIMFFFIHLFIYLFIYTSMLTRRNCNKKFPSEDK